MNSELVLSTGENALPQLTGILTEDEEEQEDEEALEVVEDGELKLKSS